MNFDSSWDKVRHVRLAHHPEFELELWDMRERYRVGSTPAQHRMAYRFKQSGKTIFVGDDYGCAPSDAVDSDAAVRGLLGFLSVQPGDTDEGYFASYTAEQLAFAERWGEELSLYALDLDEEERTERAAADGPDFVDLVCPVTDLPHDYDEGGGVDACCNDCGAAKFGEATERPT